MHDARDRRESFAFETTLAARSYVRFLTEAQQGGYVVHVGYVWLASAELAKKRVAVRVQRGGHDIPSADIARRYRRGLRNFFELYKPLADTWIIWDNSSTRLVVVADGLKGLEPTVHDRRRYKRICDAARAT
jgi:predicted ABC-type ATPase